VGRCGALIRSLAVVALVVAPTAMGRVAGALKAPPRTIYLALGDSYSSGEGLSPYLPGSGKCDRSPDAYPPVVARHLSTLTLEFVACSGATIAQIDQQVSTVPPRTWRRVAVTTVTAGGNDLPLSSLIARCMELAASSSTPPVEYLAGVSSAAQCASAIDSAAALLGAGLNPVSGAPTSPANALKLPLLRPSHFESRLVRLYRLILNATGATKHHTAPPRVIVVQYPSLLGPSGTGSCLVSPTPLPPIGSTTTVGSSGPLYPAFSSATANALRAINRYVRLETAVVVRSLSKDGYLTVSLATPGVGFSALNCANGTSPDVNGVLVASGDPPVAPGSFHPTAAGQGALASSVLAAWRRAAR
jgi:lysophospholipase L1-like esterase